jgi:hypothetical protein
MSWPPSRTVPDGRLEEAHHHADGRRLAGAVPAEEPEDRAGLDREVERVDGR